jgi:hypothetical protein
MSRPKVRRLSTKDRAERLAELSVRFGRVNRAMKELVALSAGSRGGIDWPEQRASEVVAALARLFIGVGDFSPDELRYIEATAEWTWNAEWSKESRLSRALAALGALEDPTPAAVRDILVEADYRFGELKDKQIAPGIPSLRKKRSRVSTIAAWALACGAFDARRGPNESAERAIKRVANGFRMALGRKKKKRTDV